MKSDPGPAPRRILDPEPCAACDCSRRRGPPPRELRSDGGTAARSQMCVHCRLCTHCHYACAWVPGGCLEINYSCSSCLGLCNLPISKRIPAKYFIKRRAPAQMQRRNVLISDLCVCALYIKYALADPPSPETSFCSIIPIVARRPPCRCSVPPGARPLARHSRIRRQ
eukprot:scaffold11512_cov63-Phaeocystis_antarctica.AAC.4